MQECDRINKKLIIINKNNLWAISFYCGKIYSDKIIVIELISQAPLCVRLPTLVLGVSGGVTGGTRGE